MTTATASLTPHYQALANALFLRLPEGWDEIVLDCSSTSDGQSLAISGPGLEAYPGSPDPSLYPAIANFFQALDGTGVSGFIYSLRRVDRPEGWDMDMEYRYPRA